MVSRGESTQLKMYFQRLRDLREDRDLRQREVAAFLGIAQTVYSRYERGVLCIPPVHLIRLAKFYQVSTDYILGLTNISTPYSGKGKGPR